MKYIKSQMLRYKRTKTNKYTMSCFKKPKLCPSWPRCSCIIRGYCNDAEENNCGKPPKTTTRPHISEHHK